MLGSLFLRLSEATGHHLMKLRAGGDFTAVLTYDNANYARHPRPESAPDLARSGTFSSAST